MESDDLYTRLARVPAAVISDVLRAAGVPYHTLHYSVARLYPSPTVVGPAFCIRGQRVLGGVPAKSGPNLGYDMFRRVASGDVVVIASDGYSTSPDNPLLTLANLVATPHCGGGSESSRVRTAFQSVDAVLDVLVAGVVPPYILNRPVLGHARAALTQPAPA